MLKKLREPVNSLTHWGGAILALIGLVALLVVGWDTPAKIISLAIYGVSLIFLFSASATYHMVQVKDKALEIFRKIDHAAIFVLIAGTYTPFLRVKLRGPWGWSLFAVIWTLTLLGIVLRLFLKGRLHGLVVSIYVAMGWIVVVAAQPMIERVGTGGLVLLAAGGLAYTAGVAFYKWRRLPYNHAIWHGFVLAGAALHFFAVLFYVIPWPVTAA